MVNIGCRGHDITCASGADGLGRALRSLGMDIVQLALAKSFPGLDSSGDALSPGMGRLVRRTLAAHGVGIAVLGCYYNLIDPDPAARSEGARRFEAHLRCASSFGASMVATETGSVDPTFSYTEENFRPRVFDEACGEVRRLVSVAERCGTTMAVEPGVNHPVHDVETTAELVRRVGSPALGIVLDPTALVTPDLVPRQVELCREMLDRVGSSVTCLHLVDCVVEDGCVRRCALGKGVLPAREILSLYRSRKPGGYVICEFTQDRNLLAVKERYGDLLL